MDLDTKLMLAGYRRGIDQVREGVSDFVGEWGEDFDQGAIVTEIVDTIDAEAEERFTAVYGADADPWEVDVQDDPGYPEWIISADRFSETVQKHEREEVTLTVDDAWKLAEYMYADGLRGPIAWHDLGRRQVQETAYQEGILREDQRITDDAALWIINAGHTLDYETTYVEDTYLRADTTPATEDAAGTWTVRSLTRTEAVWAEGVITEDVAAALAAARGWRIDGEVYTDDEGRGTAVVQRTEEG